MDRWTTGTAWDEYGPIYEALMVPTRHRAALTPAEADQLPIHMVARLLGVGGDLMRSSDPKVIAEAMNRQRWAAAEAAQEAARLEGREITLIEADRESGVSWQLLGSALPSPH